MLKIFVSYSHNDHALRAALETHLNLLKRQQKAHAWTDGEIMPGDEIDPAIREALDAADIILLLVSADFLASDYCIEVELKRAIERHEAGTARVIPIILRDCDWHSASFGKLKALPEDGHPVAASANQDAALAQVARTIRKIAEQIEQSGLDDAAPESTRERTPSASPRKTAPLPFHVPKSFSDHDHDGFLEAAFEHIAGAFETSLKALAEQDERCTVRFKRRSDSAFTATIYIGGNAPAECKIWYETRGLMGRGIAFSYDPSSDGSFNEQMRVEEADGDLCLKPIGMALHGRASDTLDAQAAAEYFWRMLTDRLQ